jgi:aromatic amino acid aminotransferase I
MNELFELFLERKLLVIPAAMFKATVGPSELDDRANFFRATFAGETAQIESALEIFGRVIEEWFGLVTQPEPEGVPAAAM